MCIPVIACFTLAGSGIHNVYIQQLMGLRGAGPPGVREKQWNLGGSWERGLGAGRGEEWEKNPPPPPPREWRGEGGGKL